MGGRHKDPEYHKKWWEKNKHKYRTTRPHSDPDYQKKYYKENKEKVISRQKLKRDNDTPYRLFRSVTASARKRGLECDITKEDIVVPDLCPILKVPMEQFTEFAPSVDRIDNSLGYVKGNIQVISRKANSMKYNASWAELNKFADWVKNYTPINIEELKNGSL